MNALVEIRNTSKVYQRGAQKIEVLHHINLDIDKGDFVALMGPSGLGKTTLLNLIGGLGSPTDGSIGDLDRQSAVEVLTLLQQLNRNHGKTVVMVTHDPKAAESALHTLHLDKGSLVKAAEAVA